MRVAPLRRIFATLTLVAAASTALAQTRPEDPYESWARVLTRFVNERGEVDFRALANERTDLDSFLSYVAGVSPRSAPDQFPSRQARLAYYINAYNAAAMHNVIDSGFPASLSGLTKVRFFGFKRMVFGGEKFSLYSLENDVIRPIGDERVHFALNCMSAGCPRLPRVPFLPDRLDQQLDEQAQRFFGETRNLQIFPERRLIGVSSILKFYTSDFLAKHKSLIAYINKFAPRTIPEDTRIEFIEYDWTVVAQGREARPERKSP